MSANMFVLSSIEARVCSEQEIGGKARGLVTLEGWGVRVPPWAVVCAPALGLHLTEARLWPVARRTYAELCRCAEDEIQPLSERLVSFIVAAPIPKTVVEELRRVVEALGNGPFAVRSSMVGEDGVAQSYAGQLESYLFQSSFEDVLRSVRSCWASAFASRVNIYRLRTRPDHLTIPSVAVIVQEMVRSEIAGVVFTAHPTTGERNRSLVTAAYGQGEGVVSGACNTDEYVFAHDSREEIEVLLADKDRQIIADPSGSGTVEIEVERGLRHRRCLSKTQVEELGAQTLAISQRFGRPMDIEWALSNGQFHMLQARPITSLPAAENRDGPRVVFDNSNIQESYCGVTTPLTFSFASRAYRSVYTQTYRVLGVPERALDELGPVMHNLLGLVRGRVYYNINNWYRALLVLPSFGRNKADMERMMGLQEPVDFVEDLRLSGLQKLARLPSMFFTLARLLRGFRRLPWTVPEFLQRFDRFYSNLDRAAMSRASYSQLMELLDRVWNENIGRWHVPIINDFWVMMSMGRLRRFVEGSGIENPTSIINGLLAGEDGIESTEPTRFLLRLARQARCDQELISVLKTQVPLEALSAIEARWPDFHRQIRLYIDRYGDRVMGELKLETVTLREDPSFVVHVLRNYLDRPDLDPDVLFANEKRERKQAEEKLRSRLGAIGRARMSRVLRDARASVKYRENMRLIRTRAFGIVRDIFLSIGERLVEAGKLETRRDVFFLSMDELEAYHDGRSVCTDLSGIVRIRKSEFESYERLELPHRFETTGPVYHGNTYMGPTSERVAHDVAVLRGIGCYPGVVEGLARVVLSPRDELSINGQILVTLRTDPGWAPLFPTTSGILVERGSTLSHSAVVARELGIPAIVGIPGLLGAIRDGERLRMNGSTGTVERLGQATPENAP